MSDGGTAKRSRTSGHPSNTESELRQTVTDLQNELTALRSASRQETTGLRREIALLKQQNETSVSNLRHELEALRSASRQENGRLQQENADLRQQNADLGQQNENLTARIADLRAENADLQQISLNRGQIFADHVRRLESDAADAAERLQLQRNESNEKIDRLQSQLRGLNKIVDGCTLCTAKNMIYHVIQDHINRIKLNSCLLCNEKQPCNTIVLKCHEGHTICLCCFLGSRMDLVSDTDGPKKDRWVKLNVRCPYCKEHFIRGNFGAPPRVQFKSTFDGSSCTRGGFVARAAHISAEWRAFLSEGRSDLEQGLEQGRFIETIPWETDVENDRYHYPPQDDEGNWMFRGAILAGASGPFTALEPLFFNNATQNLCESMSQLLHLKEKHSNAMTEELKAEVNEVLEGLETNHNGECKCPFHKDLQKFVNMMAHSRKPVTLSVTNACQMPMRRAMLMSYQQDRMTTFPRHPGTGPSPGAGSV